MPASHQTAVDEAQLSELFLTSSAYRTLFVERHSTVVSLRGRHGGAMNYLQRWFWRLGHLTNERDGD